MSAESSEQLLPCPQGDGYLQCNGCGKGVYVVHDKPDTRTASWTAIEDGLPTEDGEFLVAYRWNDIDGPFIKSGEFFAEDADPAAWLVDGISGEPIIVAWMPIPPYQPKTAKENDYER